jgi:PilZ domain
MTFAHQTIATANPDAAAASRRKYPRYATNCSVACKAVDGSIWDATIINASRGGFGLSRDLPLPEGADVLISIAGVGDYRCSIAWKRSDRCGLQLYAEIDWLTEDAADRLASGLAQLSY